MKVPTYQIQKILKVYIKQLIQSNPAVSADSPEGKFFQDRTHIRVKEKCRIIIDKITDDIVERITSPRSDGTFGREFGEGRGREGLKSCDFGKMKNSEFIFYVINAENEKIKSRIPVHDAGFLLKKFESLVRKAIDRNMNT